MSIGSSGECSGRLIQPPLLLGIEFTPADYIFVAAVLAQKPRNELPTTNSVKSMYDLGMEAQQRAIESRKRLEETGHGDLPEWQITSDVNVIRAIAKQLIPGFERLNQNY